jgi:lipoate-protein ligase B
MNRGPSLPWEAGHASSRVPVRWLGRVPYWKALLLQRRLRAAVLAGELPGALLLCEHPPVVTLGRRASAADLLTSADELRRGGVALFRVERGGRATWHGPGQLVGYPVVALPVGVSPSRFVELLAARLVDLLTGLGVEASWSAEAPGLWTPSGKIAALGLHTHRGVLVHGFALNLCPDLAYSRLIDPCGLGARGVTSVLRERGLRLPPARVAAAILRHGLDRAAGQEALEGGPDAGLCVDRRS